MQKFRTLLAAPLFGIGIALMGLGMLILAGGQFINGELTQQQ